MKITPTLLLVIFLCSLYASEPPFLLEHKEHEKFIKDKLYKNADTTIEMNSAAATLREHAAIGMLMALDYRLLQLQNASDRIKLLNDQLQWQTHIEKNNVPSKDEEWRGSIFPMLNSLMSATRYNRRMNELLLSDDQYQNLKYIQNLSLGDWSFFWGEVLHDNLAIANINNVFGRDDKYFYAIISPTGYLCIGQDNPSETYLCIWVASKLYAIYLLGHGVVIESANICNGKINIEGKDEKGIAFTRNYLLSEASIDKIKFTGIP